MEKTHQADLLLRSTANSTSVEDAWHNWNASWVYFHSGRHFARKPVETSTDLAGSGHNVCTQQPILNVLDRGPSDTRGGGRAVKPCRSHLVVGRVPS